MKANYDRKTDILSIIFTDTLVAESDEDKPGVILDYDEKGIWSRWRFWTRHIA